MSSIKEVAREAGVSTATVSHVINGTRFVSDEVRARVLAAVEKCRYYPNAQARSLASGKSRIIGLVISDIANPFFPELVKAIESAAFEKGYDVMLSNTNYNTERTAHYVRRFFERKVAGVAIMTSEMERDLIDELEQKEIPTVFLDVGHAGMHMNNLRVGYDEGIRQAIQHLAELGHRRIAFISGPTNLRSARRRLEAYRGIMAKLFPDQPELIFHGNFRVDGGRAAAAEIMRLKGEGFPTAVMAGNDLMAIGAISEFESEGVGVPEDVSVVGFDDIAFAAVTRPPLTTVHLPLDDLGRRAVDVLLKSLEDIKKEGIEIHIQTELVIRDSTGRAPDRRTKRQAKQFEKHVV
jgi:DNA-binding LacI/PurR family transcriptional regulator